MCITLYCMCPQDSYIIIFENHNLYAEESVTLETVSKFKGWEGIPKFYFILDLLQYYHRFSREVGGFWSHIWVAVREQ